MSDTKQPLGVLILHGFTGSLDTVRPIVPVVERLGLPYRMPVLRGHGTRYEDLVGVTPREWYLDAEAALDDLLKEVQQVLVVGLSMGGLVSLNLAMDRSERLAGLLLLTPALRFSDPLSALTPLLKLVFPFWTSPSSFNDKSLAANGTNYKRFPTATFGRLLDYSHEIERRLGEVKVPVTTFYSRKDQIIHPQTVKLLEDKLSSKDKTVVYFEQSGHEMLQDNEADAVVSAIEQAILRHVATATVRA